MCLVTGLVLGWATKWGVLRCWWVALKLILNIIMSSVLLAFLVNPIREIATGQAPLSELGVVFGLTVIASALVTVAAVISVFKPWGKIQRLSLRRLPEQPVPAVSAPADGA